jgi:hypothetical protein
VKRDARAGRSGGPIVWPAYLVAAVCFAIAVAFSLLNLSLMEQLKSAKAAAAALTQRSTGLARNLENEEATIADLMSEDGRRYDVPNGQVVVVRDRVYLTLHDVGAPPKGKVYEVWTQSKGKKVMTPSTTFIPDAHGVAVIALPVRARAIEAVAVSVEPESGSKAPTGTFLMMQHFERPHRANFVCARTCGSCVSVALAI